MARHSEEECAYCERDLLPLSYIVGEDGQLYCSIKCADAAEAGLDTEKVAWSNVYSETFKASQ